MRRGSTELGGSPAAFGSAHESHVMKIPRGGRCPRDQSSRTDGIASWWRESARWHREVRLVPPSLNWRHPDGSDRNPAGGAWLPASGVALRVSLRWRRHRHRKRSARGRRPPRRGSRDHGAVRADSDPCASRFPRAFGSLVRRPRPTRGASTSAPRSWPEAPALIGFRCA